MPGEIDLREANELFHDFESVRYDDKWGIRYDMENARRVRRKFEKLLGGSFPRVKRLLEVGCGTGYVGLNLCLHEGMIGEYNACDISQGMVETCRANAAELGIEARVKRSELEDLAYRDEEFDMVIGHAILHHIPDVPKALSEIHRVLVPGGICMLAGEPTRMGDLLGRIARRGTMAAVKLLASRGGYFGGVPMRMVSERQGPQGDSDVMSLEHLVDIHTFKPSRVCRMARKAGFEEARFESEELVSSFVGWITRTIDNQLSDENLTFRYRYWSYTTYLRLNKLDESIYRYVPSSLFYNMLLFMRKPA